MGRAPTVLGNRQIAALSLSLVAAAALLLAAESACAEWRVETTIAPPPATKPRAPAARPKVEVPTEEETPEPASTERQPAENPEEEEPAEETRESATTATPAPGVADGVSTTTEPQQPQDGIIVVGEPTSTRDGIPNLGQDPRLAEDAAAFTSPPAGYNPYLYQIEIEPLADRRTADLFRLEPYTARGVRIGSFVIFPEAELSGLANSNVFRSTSPRGDSALDLRGNVRVVSDWSAHAMELRASGLATFYQEFPTEDDRAYALEARGRFDFSRYTNIETLVSRQLDKAIRSTRDSPTDAAERGDIETSRAVVALNHRFNRLSLQLRGAITDVDFAPVANNAGGIISNAERDYTQREAAFRASWAVNNKVGVFTETAVNDREFYAAPADGILRSSHGERYRVGVAFGPWDATIRGEVSAGWGRQTPNDARLGDIDGVIVDANLAWRATALTTFLLTASSDFVDTTATGSGGALSRLIGLEARHAFRRHLIGTAAVRYLVTPYDSVDLTERTLTSELGLDYYLGRDTMLFARYQHIVYDTTIPASDFTADIVRVGMRVRQ